MGLVQKPLQKEVNVNNLICLSLPDNYLKSEQWHTLDVNGYTIPVWIGHYTIVLHVGRGKKRKKGKKKRN